MFDGVRMVCGGISQMDEGREYERKRHLAQYCSHCHVSSRIMYGYVWLCVVVFVHAWSCMVMYDYVGLCKIS